LKEIGDRIKISERISHTSIFQNSPEYSLYILIQIILYNNYSTLFPTFDIRNILYKEGENYFDIIETIIMDLRIIKGTDMLINYISNELVSAISSEFENIDNYQDITQLGIRYSYPPEFLEILDIKKTEQSPKEFEALLKSINSPASVCIRVNRKNIDVQTLIQDLVSNNITCRQSLLMPTCVVLSERQQLMNLQSYKKG
jgi:hypothetical protein